MLFEHILTDEDVPNEYVQDVINRLSYIKPLRGVMKRKIRLKSGEDVEVELFKNFHDEREWRYVPKSSNLASFHIEAVIANPRIVKLHDEISNQLTQEKYNELLFELDGIQEQILELIL